MVDGTLIEVTPGLILNVVVVGILATLGVLAAVGEFVIRNFMTLQRKPGFLVREIRLRAGGPSTGTTSSSK